MAVLLWQDIDIEISYTIAGCTGATIASRVGDITPKTTGTATLDYSDLSNISFIYNAE